MTSIVGTPQWNESMKEYAAAQAAAEAKGWVGWEHAYCDHAEGYCPVEAGKAIPAEEWSAVQAHASKMAEAIKAWDEEYA
jgi:hypothetical protein